LIGLLFLLSSMSACIPEPVEISIPQLEPSLVVASQILGDQIIFVQLSRSFGALEFSESNGDTLSNDFLDQILVDSARVTVAYRDGVDTLINIGGGFYVTAFTPLYEGDTYMLSVYDSATGLEAFAQSEVLPIANWENVDYFFEAQSLTFNDTLFTDTVLQIATSWQDLVGESYYMVNAYKVSLTDNGDPSDIFFGQAGPPTYTYSDQLFPNAVIADTIPYTNFQQGDTIAVALSHISKGYYEYLTTRQRSATSLFANLLAEPVNYPTNVDRGYGFFNLHLPSVQLFILE